MPNSGVARVAFLVSDMFTLIDIAGPMQTFDQVQVPSVGFETFTVSETRTPIRTAGMTIVLGRSAVGDLVRELPAAVDGP